jgi:CheY-like chemotaxis protein
MTAGRYGALAGTVSDRRRILLCDAESQSLHALRVVLHGAGFEVDATRTAAEAQDRGALRVPTAAIIELVLPDGDGVEVCRRLREWSAMPVILLSALCDEEVQVRAFEAGADDYLTKPFRPARAGRTTACESAASRARRRGAMCGAGRSRNRPRGPRRAPPR